MTQIDLPSRKSSGLIEARPIVSDIPGIRFIEFDEKDVVRHPLVQRIVRAYDQYQRPEQTPDADSPAPEENGVSPVR